MKISVTATVEVSTFAVATVRLILAMTPDALRVAVQGRLPAGFRVESVTVQEVKS